MIIKLFFILKNKKNYIYKIMKQSTCSTIINIENYQDVHILSNNIFINIKKTIKSGVDIFYKKCKNIITFGYN